MPRAWISLGANLGRPQATLTAAAKALEQSDGIAHLSSRAFTALPRWIPPDRTT